MRTWITYSFPTPLMGGRSASLRFGIINAEGMDVSNIDPTEVGLIEWNRDLAHTRLTWG